MNILYEGFQHISVDMNMLLDDFVRYIVHLYHKGQCDMLLHKLDLHIFLTMDILDHSYIVVWWTLKQMFMYKSTMFLQSSMYIRIW